MAAALVPLTVVLCAVHLAVFREPRTLGFYLPVGVHFGAAARLPGSIVLDTFASRRERAARAGKLNIGGPNVLLRGGDTPVAAVRSGGCEAGRNSPTADGAE